MKAFKSVVLIGAVVGTMIFVASPQAQSNPALLPACADSVFVSVVAAFCPVGCTCTGGCTCGIGNPCKHSDCKAARTTPGCEACCNTGLAEVWNCEQKCAAPV